MCQIGTARIGQIVDHTLYRTQDTESMVAGLTQGCASELIQGTDDIRHPLAFPTLQLIPVVIQIVLPYQVHGIGAVQQQLDILPPCGPAAVCGPSAAALQLKTAAPQGKGVMIPAEQFPKGLHQS